MRCHRLILPIPVLENIGKRIVFRGFVFVNQSVGFEHVAQNVHLAFQVDEAVLVQGFDLFVECFVDFAYGDGDSTANFAGFRRVRAVFQLGACFQKAQGRGQIIAQECAQLAEQLGTLLQNRENLSAAVLDGVDLCGKLRVGNQVIGAGTVLVPWGAICMVLGLFEMGAQLLLLYGILYIIRRIFEPRILGGATGFSSLQMLFSMYAGMRIAGVTGLIIAPIIWITFMNFIKTGILDGVFDDIRFVADDIRKTVSRPVPTKTQEPPSRKPAKADEKKRRFAFGKKKETEK